MNFWTAMALENKFPTLVKLSEKFKTMNPSNAFIERVHSIFTLVVGQRRHHLNADRLFKIVFIRMIIRGNGVYRWDNKSEATWNAEELDDAKIAGIIEEIMDDIDTADTEDEVDEVILV